jgi:hypothetical protein
VNEPGQGTTIACAVGNVTWAELGNLLARDLRDIVQREGNTTTVGEIQRLRGNGDTGTVKENVQRDLVHVAAQALVGDTSTGVMRSAYLIHTEQQGPEEDQ